MIRKVSKTKAMRSTLSWINELPLGGKTLIVSINVKRRRKSKLRVNVAIKGHLFYQLANVGVMVQSTSP